ncbi:MAG: polysaccharide deacetylase family protein [Patescibacteria group bacterium]
MKAKTANTKAPWLFFIALVLFGALVCYYVVKSNFQSDVAETEVANNSNQVNANSTPPVANTNNQLNSNVPVNSQPPTNTANTNAPAPTETPAGEEIVRIDTKENMVVFTFDAGSSDVSLTKILEALAAHQLTGTFFMTGTWAEKFPEGVKQIATAGHEIYNHTYSHPHLTQLSDAKILEEFSKTEQLVKNLTGKTTKPYFRAPYGERNDHILEVASQAGYQSVYWSTDALDWEESTGMTAEKVRTRVLDNLKPGAIFLMHVGDTITGSILNGLFESIEQKGYQISSLGNATGQ